ncbi:MAG: hypothetical protein JOZ27_03860 [Caulobacteraceae bacterium]|nr:hypothetical protein [Caulobacteraceae bacterium]
MRGLLLILALAGCAHTDQTAGQGHLACYIDHAGSVVAGPTTDRHETEVRRGCLQQAAARLGGMHGDHAPETAHG